MKTADYEFEIDGVSIHFYHDQQTHRYDVVIDYNIQEPFNVSKAKGEAIVDFLKFFMQSTRLAS